MSSSKLPQFALSWLATGLLMTSAQAFAATASAPSGDRYVIQSGDTLSSISQRLFGDSKYWPRLHAWNHGSIQDPDLIRAGDTIVYQQGVGASLPTISVARAQDKPSTSKPVDRKIASTSGATDDSISMSAARSKRRSDEWKNLPLQAWEKTSDKLPDGVDYQGFDKSNVFFFKQTKGFELDAVAASGKLDSIGQIVASRMPSQYLTLGDTVYIRPDGDTLKVGETYAITSEPSKLKSAKADREGYSYLIVGQVKITATQDDLMVGTIVAGKALIARGMELMPLPARVPQMDPLPGPSAVEGTILLDRNLSTYTTAQFRQVFVNRGSDDGVQAGMVFRCYEHFDPSNDKRISTADFIDDADMMVVQVSPRFSTAVVMSSTTTVSEDSAVTLLMDVADLRKKFGTSDNIPAPQAPKGNDLDELDGVGGGLAPNEKAELEQLERWKGNPPAQPPVGAVTAPAPAPAVPSAAVAPAPIPAPTDVAAPPPPTSDSMPPAPVGGANSVAPAPAPAPADQLAPLSTQPQSLPGQPQVQPLPPAPQQPPSGAVEQLTPPAPPAETTPPPSNEAPAAPTKDQQDLDRLLDQ